MEHGNWFSLSVVGILSGMILWKILSARQGRELFIRKIPGVDAIDEAVGRATEMGRPILFSTGLGGLDIITLQALAIVGRVARLAAQYRTRLIIPMVDTVVLPIAEEICREAYNEAGQPEAFNPEDIRFLSGSQFAYASGVVGIMNRERVSANFMFGSFFAEALILAETGQAVGAVQVAGTPSTLQVPFFIVSCDYTILGEEYYATSAYLTREPTLLGSLVGQDYGKIFLSLAVVLGLLAAGFLGKVYHPPAAAQQLAISAATAPTVHLPVEERKAYLTFPQAGATVPFVVRLPREGEYVLWARIGVRGRREDSFEVRVDEGQVTSIGGRIGAPDQEWSWVRVNVYPLKQGKHQVAVTWRTAQGRLDKLVFCRAKAWYQRRPEALAFHASSVPEVAPSVQAQPDKLISLAGGSVRFAVNMHQGGSYWLWLRLGPGEGAAPAVRVQLDSRAAFDLKAEKTEKSQPVWVKAGPLSLTAGVHTLTVEWVEEAALYEVLLGRSEFDPTAMDLTPFYADYVPEDASVSNFLVEPGDRYTLLWEGG